MVERTTDAEIVQKGGPLASHVKLYLDFKPPAGTLWSMMWDELAVASIVEPSVIEIRNSTGCRHHAWTNCYAFMEETEDAAVFLPYSGQRTAPFEMDRPFDAACATSSCERQMEGKLKKFEDVFVEMMSHSLIRA